MYLSIYLSIYYHLATATAILVLNKNVKFVRLLCFAALLSDDNTTKQKAVCSRY